MKFLANENIPKASIQLLRALGHDVLSIASDHPGISDLKVLELVSRENRVVVTFDSDYGELLYLRESPCPPAVLYLRFDPRTPTEPAEIVQALLATDAGLLDGHFVVLDRTAARRRPLPDVGRG